MFRLFMKRHHVIVKEEDVTKALKVISDVCPCMINQQLVVGPCGWVIEPDKWFIHFDCSSKQWRQINDEFELIESLIIDENRF